MNKETEKALNKQINEEFFSAYLYLSMASYFDNINLIGFSSWMKVQYEEEFFHAMKFYNYMNERGSRVILDTIKKPKSDFSSPLQVFEASLEHEKVISSYINNLYELALDKKDYPLQSFLKWYIDEQVEEEDNVGSVVERIKLAGDGAGMFILDKELGERVFTPPAK